VRCNSPGRLRVSVRRNARELLDRLESVRRAAPPGIAIQLRPQSRSALISYDPRLFSGAEILQFLVTQSEPATAGMAFPELPLCAGFSVLCDIPGRLRLGHASLGRNAAVRQSVGAGLLGLSGVLAYQVSAVTGTVVVSYRESVVSREALIRALVAFVQRGLAAPPGQAPDAPLEWNRAAVQLSLSGAALGVAAAAKWWPALGGVALGGTVAAALHTLLAGVRGLLRRRPTVDTLDSTAIVLGLRAGYTLPVAAMVCLLNTSEVLLDRTRRRSRDLITGFFNLHPQTVHCAVDGGIEERKLSEMKPGDVLVVLSGEQIPLDGVILDGAATVDQAAMTGEFAPVDKMRGDEVLALTGVVSGQLRIRVMRSGESTNAARIMKIVQESSEHRVALQASCERFAERMVVPTFALGGSALAVSGSSAMMAVINADFGTGIRIAGPLAMLSSISAGLTRGILIKSGSVLEKLNKVDVVIFDKTGTLTEAVPEVRRVVCLDRAWSERELLGQIASAEHRFRHPIANAIISEARNRGIAITPPEASDNRLGLGIEVRTANGVLRVGSRRFLETLGLRLPARAAKAVRDIDARGGSCVFAALESRVMGLVELEAAARPEAKDVIRRLRENRGIRDFYVLSGDHRAPTARFAARLGIEKYFHDVMPHEKANCIRELQKQGLRVAMIGDGVNDCAALAQADCGISLRGGADAAMDAADVVLMDGTLTNIDLLFQISENLEQNVRSSFRLLVFCNSFLILGALAGALGLASSVVLNNGLNVAAILNGRRAQRELQRDAS
jgi:heavy metal translocating P-type ATPase